MNNETKTEENSITEVEASDGNSASGEAVENITVGSVIMNSSVEWFAEVMVGQKEAEIPVVNWNTTINTLHRRTC